ncbi:HlyD family secretion protein [Pseudomonas sp. BIGb0427]|uniref:efflux RND transporter periplasmic adaptor subunit n=1 Tax=unclassified Pseudomonas TaxID=196821 RepID=UPI0016A47650|nr:MULTISPECIES: HlyD family secretion protein [unclassified Pseudomonas]NLU59640.1 HlyD family secretion protein [Pseudomonas sp. BIGb0427]QPG64488.1 HlyD family secretion protein [Pseudomonas sp. BIGb0427]UVM55975.1 HlyD family secretion protein [Pseudomonas sp. B21-012]UVM66927.1 HlyD family secretion protein [Pseudomonas sp. B21-009]
MNHVVRLFKFLATLVVGAFSLYFGLSLWNAYVLAPWTRDGRISAQVIRIAPEVSGSIERVWVGDNQWVQKGELMYSIDARSYALAVDQKAAELAEVKEVFQQRNEELRRRKLLVGVVPKEEIDNAVRTRAIANARLNIAQAQLAQAQLELQRTKIFAPVDGYVTQLRLQPGDYAVAGGTNMFVVDSKSFWVTGYFEETKLTNIPLGAHAKVKLMGFSPLLSGHVSSIGRGVSDTNEVRAQNGLPQVSPTFSWIRLAQRLPVRIEIDHIPEGVELAAGMTASIEVDQAGAPNHRRLTHWLQEFL